MTTMTSPRVINDALHAELAQRWLMPRARARDMAAEQVERGLLASDLWHSWRLLLSPIEPVR